LNNSYAKEEHFEKIMLKILGATIENLVPQETWCWGFVHYDILTGNQHILHTIKIHLQHVPHKCYSFLQNFLNVSENRSKFSKYQFNTKKNPI
jgi:hypothetical protein